MNTDNDLETHDDGARWIADQLGIEFEAAKYAYLHSHCPNYFDPKFKAHDFANDASFQSQLRLYAEGKP